MALRRFSDNPAASTPLTGTEIIPGLQSGADVQMTAQDIADLAGTGGAEDFTDLADVPSSYTGEAGKLVAVNGTEDGLEFVSGSGGAVDSVNGQTGTVVLELGDLDDVDAATPTDGYVLTWNNTDGEWKAAAATGGMSNPMTTAGDIIYGGASGTPVRLAAGTDGHVLTLVSGDPAWAAPGGGALTNWTEAANSSAPNATVPVVSFSANNAASSVDVVIASKGSGGLAREVADSTATGGNKRGTDSVDLQSVRATAAQVASGARACIPGGFNNTASAQAAFAMGQTCNASGQQAVAMGESNTASGMNSVALGGSGGAASATDAVALAGGTANAVGAFAMGRGANTNSVTGAFAECYNSQPPRSRYSLYGQTTNATPLTLTTTGSGTGAATNQVYFGGLNNRSGIYRGLIVARQSGNGGAKMSWQFVAHLDRDNNTVSLVGAVTPTVVASSAGPPAWAVAVTADNTLKTLKVEVTGAAATTINWACFVDGQECTG
ncbi:hypothetical protein [Pseudoxanthomonas koreensis]|uniref:hypothetical protein n=1 Tax=Pseudoxanthomonas koreensis TaxID=266061 RepID=UPI001391798B|nr:hypothetical protein [Pseudoxanthomonas koreensis]KAF1692646.1 hypothetical protein CSC64_06570 [Pseudoxanthomonas koreensis]